MTFPQSSPSVCARQIELPRVLELRREIIAAMRLHGSFDRRVGLTRPPSQNHSQQPPDAAPIHGKVPEIRILSICDYDGLRLSREWLLSREGYSTESHNSRDPIDELPLPGFQLAILCHSVAEEQAIRIAAVLRRYNPRIQVLRLCNSYPRRSSPFDRELDSSEEPAKLLEVVRETVLRVPTLHPRA